MNLTLFIGLLFSLQLIYWFIGKRASKKIEGNEDYFLAGKKVPFFPLMMTFVATQVGGGVVLGSADEAYRHGWSVLFYPLGMALGLIVLGLGVGRRIAQFPVSTMAQILEVVYKSPSMKRVASILSILSLFMVLVGQIIGSYKFLLAIGFSNDPLFIFFWAIVILYTVRGGLKAVISTDIAQAAVFSVIFFFCFFYARFHGAPLIPSPVIEQAAMGGSLKWVGWLLLPLLFMTIEQDMGQRCFAGKSAKTVSLATFWSGILTFLIALVPIYFGVLGRSLSIAVPDGASVLMTVIATLTTPWISSIVGCAVMAAIISTATSLINAISSNISQDFTFFQNRSNLSIMQLTTLAISAGAILFSFYCTNIIDVLMQSYELSVSCLFIPIFVALFKKKGYFLSALFSLLSGLFGFIFFKFYPAPIASEICSIALSGFGYAFGEAIEWLREKKGVQSVEGV